jgi:hypothetical protein
MRIFGRKRKPLEPLVVDTSSRLRPRWQQDDAPGPSALDFEALEQQEVAKDAGRHGLGRSAAAGRLYNGQPLRSIGEIRATELRLNKRMRDS